MGIYSNDHFAIWPGANDLHFAFDSTHLIRVGKNEPFPLKYMKKKNGLLPVSPSDAESVIKSLVKGETVKLRYFEWPSHNKFDVTLQNQNLAYVYKKAVNEFGWKDFDISAKLAPLKIDIYVPKDPYSKGYASLSVVGNRDLGLKKGYDKYGGGCYISVGMTDLFGIMKRKWVCEEVDRAGRKIIIRDSNDRIVFQGVVPKTYGKQRTGNLWPLGADAAKAAWSSAPLGSIELEGRLGKKTVLYGFKELWRWGVENACLPSLE